MSSVFSASIAISPAGSIAGSAVQQEQPAQGQLGQGHATSTVTCVSSFTAATASSVLTTSSCTVFRVSRAASTPSTLISNVIGGSATTGGESVTTSAWLSWPLVGSVITSNSFGV